MMSQDRLKRHAALVDRMAQARGLDLEEASLRGGLTPSDISDAVLACTGCATPDACAKWLDAQETEGTTAAQTPGYCRNAALFDELSKS